MTLPSLLDRMPASTGERAGNAVGACTQEKNRSTRFRAYWTQAWMQAKDITSPA